jgi:histidyl-tRNA synthetase
VFEIADTDAQNNRSMMGGGRYNGLVGLFGVDPVPTAGFGWGDVTLQNFLESHGLNIPMQVETELYVILIGDIYKPTQKLLETLRAEGLRVAVDDTDRKPANKLKSALKKGIRYALFVGEEELVNNQFNLKDLKAETEQTLSPERIISLILDERNK